MKSIKKLVTIPLAAIAIYGITSCTQMQPYSVEFGQGYKCETRSKENRIKFYKDGKLIGEKNKTPQGEETYWFTDNEGNFYEEKRHTLKIRPQSDYSGELAEEFRGYVNKKIKEGKKILEELKEGECLLERLIENKSKKEPRRVGTVPLNEIEERQTSDLGLDLGGLEPYGCGKITRHNTNSIKSEVSDKLITDLGGLEPYVTTGYFDYLRKHDKQFVIIYRR